MVARRVGVSCRPISDGVAPSTDTTYEAARCLWTQWCLVVVRAGLYLDTGLGEETAAREITKYSWYGAFAFFLVEIKHRRSKGIGINVAFASPNGDRIADEAFYR